MITAKDLREQSSSLSILYVEDEAILRSGMEGSLSKLFEKTYVAVNGQEAFEIYKKEEIDLVMTDINMPIMDGMELIHNIHKYAQAEPMIIVTSAHNDSKLLAKLINKGVDGFLNKPIDKQQMINILYKCTKILHDRKMLVEYELKLQNELELADRKNRVLEQKLTQLAVQTNKNEKQKSIATQKSEGIKREGIKSENYFETLLIDDKDELRDLANELDNFIAMMFQGERLNIDYIVKLSGVYRKYASVLNTYPEFFDVASYLLDFSESMLQLENKFMKDIEQTGIFFESLQLTLENYRENIWNKEAKDPKFYNASLKNDIQLIIDYLEDKEAQESEIEFF